MIKKFLVLPLVDAFTLIAFSFIIFWVYSSVLMNPPTQEDGAKADGPFFVEIEWDGDSNCDVDLHMINPELKVCFFGKPATGGMFLNLDDVGDHTMPGQNKEKMTVAVPKQGEYIIYLHGYRITEKTPVKLVLYENTGDVVIKVFEKEIILENTDQRELFCRFEVTEDFKYGGHNEDYFDFSQLGG